MAFTIKDNERKLPFKIKIRGASYYYKTSKAFLRKKKLMPKKKDIRKYTL